jgi:hydroxymethylbilane synthase
VERAVGHDDDVLTQALRALDDPVTRAAVTAERSLLAALEAGCSAPVGAYADVDGDGGQGSEVYLRAVVVSVDGAQSVRMSITGPLVDAVDLGRRLADDMIAEGASGLMGERVP